MTNKQLKQFENEKAAAIPQRQLDALAEGLAQEEENAIPAQ